MDPAQRKALRQAARTPGASAAQAMAVLFGLGTIVITVQAFLGYTDLDPTTFTELVFVVAFLSLGCGIASRSLRAGVHAAIRTGVVLELRGVPSRSALPGAIDIGGVSFCGGKTWIRFVRRDALNLLTYVEVGAPANGKLRVLLLGVNHQQFPRAERGVVALSSGPAGPTVPAGAGAAGA